MGYRPEEQALVPAIDIILEGFRGLDKAVGERRKDDTEWSSKHLDDLADVQVASIKITNLLHRIKRETW